MAPEPSQTFDLPPLPVSLEAMFQAVNSHAIVSIADAAGRIVYANPLFCRISGYDLGELLGQNHRIVKSSLHPPEFFRQMWETIAAWRVWQGEVCNRHKSGGLYWVQATIFPCLDAAGLPTHYVSVRTDVTQQRLQMEEITRLALEREELLRLAPVGIASLDERRFTRLNEAFANLLGYRVEELLGGSTRPIYFSDAQFQQMGDEAYESLRRGGIYQAETPLRRKDGSTLWVIWGVCSLTPEDPTRNTLFVIQDISAHKALEDKLAIALGDSQAAERAKTAFLNAMSHEMRTPLNGILGVAQIFAMQVNSDDDRALVDELAGAARHLLRMVDEALAMTAAADAAPAEAPECRVGDLVARCLWEARKSAEERGVRLEDAVPPPVGQCPMALDTARLQQLLDLVIDNAVRYNREGGTVTVAASEERGRLRLAVRDTGVGMTPEQVARLGEPFVRFCDDGNRPGAGLGWSLAYRLAAKLGAELAIASQPGVGTEVTIALPAAAG